VERHSSGVVSPGRERSLITRCALGRSTKFQKFSRTTIAKAGS